MFSSSFLVFHLWAKVLNSYESTIILIRFCKKTYSLTLASVTGKHDSHWHVECMTCLQCSKRRKRIKVKLWFTHLLIKNQSSRAEFNRHIGYQLSRCWKKKTRKKHFPSWWREIFLRLNFASESLSPHESGSIRFERPSSQIISFEAGSQCAPSSAQKCDFRSHFSTIKPHLSRAHRSHGPSYRILIVSWKLF